MEKIATIFDAYEPIEIMWFLGKSNPTSFLVIEKATSTFQNLHRFMSDTYLSNKWHFVSRKVEKWIQWIPRINGRLKCNLRLKLKQLLGIENSCLKKPF